jgi:hypothetical protein
VAELEGYAAVYELAAATDPWAADRLAAVRSWLDGLAAAGGDGEIAGLFLTFAREDLAGWVGRGVA